MLRVMKKADMRGLGVLRRLCGDISSAVVVLLDARRIHAADHQTQAAAFRDASRKEREVVELVFLNLSHRYWLGLPKRFTISRPHRRPGQCDRRAVGQNLV